MKRTLLLMISIPFFAQANNEINDFYTSSYTGYYKGKDVGTLERTFSQTDKDRYQIYSKSNIKGFYGFIPVKDKRVETSSFFIDKDFNYKPIHYKMERSGTWLDFTMDINFDYTKNSVHFKYKDREETKEISTHVLDNALYLLKLQNEIKNGNRDSVRYDIAYKTGFRDYFFKYTGTEKIKVDNKNIEAIRFNQIDPKKPNRKKAIYTWFDPKQDFVLVKLVYINDDGEEEARFELNNYKQVNNHRLKVVDSY